MFLPLPIDFACLPLLRLIICSCSLSHEAHVIASASEALLEARKAFNYTDLHRLLRRNLFEMLAWLPQVSTLNGLHPIVVLLFFPLQLIDARAFHRTQTV